MAWHCGSQGCRTHSSPDHQCPNWRMAPIRGSVGQGGANRPGDVQVVEGALNRIPVTAGGPSAKLTTSGTTTPALIPAIKNFQQAFFGTRTPDGRVDVGGQTYRALARQLHFKRIAVDLSHQTLEAFEDGRVVHHFDCVTGDANHPTNAGTFSIIRKNHPYRSRTYDVQMDYAMFFTSDGKAIHQYHGAAGLSLVRTLRQGVSDWFGSHGCVRLEEANARTLYNWTPVGTRVTVF